MPLPYRRTSSTKDKDGKARPPIIVRRVKRVVRTGHSSAWKVAYADFVTAMMAFFLLLWLLSTSSKATLEGLAEYFTPASGVSDKRPIGISNATPTPISAMEKGINLSSPGVMREQAGSTRNSPDRPSPVDAEQEDHLFEEGAKAIQQAIRSDPQLAQYRDNIAVGMTPDGLRIDLKDSTRYPMFEHGSAELTEHGRMVLARMVPLIKRMPNYMSITGFTDASARESVARWQLSAGRAEGALRYLVRSGMEAERPQKIIGAADSELRMAGEPRDANNRRISLLMMRGSHILIPEAAVPGAVR